MIAGNTVAGFFTGSHRRPSWRRKHLDEGFCIRDSRVQIVNRKWAQVVVPKLGLVKFRLSRPLPAGKLGMARVTYRADVIPKGRLALLGEMALRLAAGVFFREMSDRIRCRLEAVDASGETPVNCVPGSLAGQPT